MSCSFLHGSISSSNGVLNSAGIGCHIHMLTTTALITCFMLTTYVLLHPVLAGFRARWTFCAKFGLENDVEYNPIKSLCMDFKPCGFYLKCTNIHMNLNKLAYLNQANYLDVIVIILLKDDEDIFLRLLCNFYAKSNSIIRKCSTGVKLPGYVCFMHSVVQFTVPNYGLTLIRTLI